MQMEGTLIYIFKRGGSVIAEPVRPNPDRDRPEDRTIPSLRASLYIPFCRYGIVGLTDGKSMRDTKEQWTGFLVD